MSWRVAGPVLALATLLVAAACVARIPVLGVECEIPDRDQGKFGLWCSKLPSPPSELTPIPGTWQSPRLLERRSFSVHFR